LQRRTVGARRALSRTLASRCVRRKEETEVGQPYSTPPSTATPSTNPCNYLSVVVFNTRAGVPNTRLGVSNTRAGVSTNHPGVSNTHPGVSNTGGCTAPETRSRPRASRDSGSRRQAGARVPTPPPEPLKPEPQTRNAKHETLNPKTQVSAPVRGASRS
jgi:hypothetical protein